MPVPITAQGYPAAQRDRFEQSKLQKLQSPGACADRCQLGGWLPACLPLTVQKLFLIKHLLSLQHEIHGAPKFVGENRQSLGTVRNKIKLGKSQVCACFWIVHSILPSS